MFHAGSIAYLSGGIPQFRQASIRYRYSSMDPDS